MSTHWARDDAQSVDLTVAKLREEAYDPVLLYKPQGSDGPDNIGKESFLLGLQTKFQAQMLAKHGQELICVDATHGLTGIDFQLLIIMVVDEYHHGM